VKSGFECGLTIDEYYDFCVGDIIECETVQMIKKPLEMTSGYSADSEPSFDSDAGDVNEGRPTSV
jgi:hypothetical protein